MPKHIIIFIHGTYDQRVSGKSFANRVSGGALLYGTENKTGAMPYEVGNLEAGALSRDAVRDKAVAGEIDTIGLRRTYLQRLAGYGPNDGVDIMVWGWSGRCQTEARAESGLEFARWLDIQNLKGNTVSVVTHSHGGNVLGHALTYFSADDKIIRNAYIFSCPFFTGENNDDLEGRKREELPWLRIDRSQTGMGSITSRCSENLWLKHHSLNNGFSKVEKTVYSFWNSEDIIQSTGAGMMHGASKYDTYRVIPDLEKRSFLSKVEAETEARRIERLQSWNSEALRQVIQIGKTPVNREIRFPWQDDPNTSMQTTSDVTKGYISSTSKLGYAARGLLSPFGATSAAFSNITKGAKAHTDMNHADAYRLACISLYGEAEVIGLASLSHADPW